MKRIILFIALVIMMASCATTKKVAQANIKSDDTTTVSASIDAASHVVVDTTKTDSGKITIVEIEFYEPTTPVADSTTPVVPDNPTIVIKDDGIHIDNAANVKAVKTTTIESNSTESGETHIDRAITASVDSSNVSVTSGEYNEDETPVENPNGKNVKTSIGLILGILIAIIVLVLIIWFIVKR